MAGAGAQQFGFKCSTSWNRDKYDQDHPCTFTSEPPIMKDKITVKGRSWLVPTGPTTCDAWYYEEINVRVIGVGSKLEQVPPARRRRPRHNT